MLERKRLNEYHQKIEIRFKKWGKGNNMNDLVHPGDDLSWQHVNEAASA